MGINVMMLIKISVTKIHDTTDQRLFNIKNLKSMH